MSTIYSTKQVNKVTTKLYKWKKYDPPSATQKLDVEERVPAFDEPTSSLDAFHQLFPPELIHHILQYSNVIGRVLYENFQDISVNEFLNWIGFSIHQGAMEDRDLSLKMMFSEYGRKFYSVVMTEEDTIK